MARSLLVSSSVLALFLFAGLTEKAWGQPRILPPQMSPVTVQRVKLCTIFIKVTEADGLQASGSGFLAFEPGIVITNAHVVGMLEASSKPPKSIELYLNSGEGDKEVKMSGKVLSVDRTADLAVIRMVDKPADVKLPPPLPLNYREELYELQPVYIFGFPLGEAIGKNVTVSASSVSALRKDAAGALDKIQVNGGMQHGNSGGPVVNSLGELVGVAVSGVDGTQINFAIPAQKVQAFRDGRIHAAKAGELFREEGSEDVHVPLQYICLDPLNRIHEIKVEVWSGKKAAKRTFNSKQSETKPGDSKHETYSMKYDKEIATGDIRLPKVPEGEVGWIQPIVVFNAQGESSKGEDAKAGMSKWGKPISFDATQAVDRLPSEFKVKLVDKNERTVHIKSLQTITVNLGNQSIALTRTVDFDLLESVNNDLRGALVKTGYGKQKYIINKGDGKEMFVPEIADQVAKLPNSYFLDMKNKITSRLGVRMDEKMPPEQQHEISHWLGQISLSYEAANMVLPDKEVKPREKWNARWPLTPTLGGDEVELTVTCMYEGIRTRSGNREALVSFAGRLRSPGVRRDLADRGPIQGKFTFDPALGFITSAHFKIAPEIAHESGLSRAIDHDIDVELSRVDGNPNKIEIPKIDPSLIEKPSFSLVDLEAVIESKKFAVIKVENATEKLVKDGTLNGHSIFGQINTWMKERHFYFKDLTSGVTKFSVEEDGVVVMAVSPRFHYGEFRAAPGAGVFANLKEPWYSECKTNNILTHEGWQEAGYVQIMGKFWPLYWRECKKGENYSIRTEKEWAPIMITK